MLRAIAPDHLQEGVADHSTKQISMAPAAEQGSSCNCVCKQLKIGYM
jgi:hypothetical protein